MRDARLAEPRPGGRGIARRDADDARPACRDPPASPGARRRAPCAQATMRSARPADVGRDARGPELVQQRQARGEAREVGIRDRRDLEPARVVAVREVVVGEAREVVARAFTASHPTSARRQRRDQLAAHVREPRAPRREQPLLRAAREDVDVAPCARRACRAPRPWMASTTKHIAARAAQLRRVARDRRGSPSRTAPSSPSAPARRGDRAPGRSASSSGSPSTHGRRSRRTPRSASAIHG